MTFASALLAPDAPIPDDVVAPKGGPVTARFNVYRNNVTASLVEAMAAGFPVVLSQVGDQFFKAMAVEFIRAHPPIDPRLVLYGTDFPQFLENFPPIAHLPWLADTARLELALRASYHARDTALFDPEHLNTPKVESATLHLAPSLQVLSSPYPIHEIWRAASEPGAPAPHGGAQTVLITRPEYDPTCDLIDAPFAQFITALSQAPLGIAAATPQLDVAGALSLLLTRNAIDRLEFPT
ncbi:MAG: HvfC/BufC family peptide modification chaperone [Maritimibacter sp.]